jgi:hypothetical protein
MSAREPRPVGLRDAFREADASPLLCQYVTVITIKSTLIPSFPVEFPCLLQNFLLFFGKAVHSFA